MRNLNYLKLVKRKKKLNSCCQNCKYVPLMSDNKPELSKKEFTVMATYIKSSRRARNYCRNLHIDLTNFSIFFK